jgi:hypothetical protein
MKEAFKDKPLTDEEIFNVTAFLQHVAGNEDARGDRNYGVKLFFTGVGGALLLMGLFSGMWYRSKKKSVNQDIYDRQVKATWKSMNDSERIG